MMAEDKKYSFGLIGCGNLGFPLALKLNQAGALEFLFCRNKQTKNKLIASNIEPTKIISSIDLLINYFKNNALPNVLIIAVSDNAIDDIFELIFNNYPKIHNYVYVFHTSGFLSIEPLLKYTDEHLKVFAAHPFQTFYEAKQDIFENLIWGVEKGNTGENEISEILSILSGTPFFLDISTQEQKQIYHLIAVASSNFLKATLEFAKILANEISFKNIDIIKQIVNRSIKDVFDNFSNGDFTLTGPLARKDLPAIQKHLQSLSSNIFAQKIYAEFSLATLDILFSKNSITKEEYNKFRLILLQILMDKND
jgi:predicted short-subunit dehydrogenase-like oxidoreductase (DUF2520 family)